MIFDNQGIQGFDVSHYQDDNNTPQTIDFAKMKAWGANFVIVRAGQGFLPDPDLAVNWQNAKAAGLPRGAYWFFDPRIEPKMQAQAFYDQIKNDPPEGRLWIDLEYPPNWGGRFFHWTDWRLMLETLKSISGLRIGIYTANWWWSAQIIPLEGLLYFGSFPLWVAQYKTQPEYVNLPAGWKDCLIWQDGTPPIGELVGVESIEVDHNLFNGGADAFAAEFGATITPPQPPTEEHLITGTALGSVNIRTAPNGDPTGRYLLKGDKIEADKNQNQWLHLTKINGVTQTDPNLWASAGTSQQYISWQIVTDPPPVDPPVVVDPTVTHVIRVNTVGQISTDGLPFE